MVDRSEHHVHRRVTGHHDIRLDGIGDLLFRASGASVLDVGCNRGMAGLEFAANGATLVHGCDNYELGITVAREVFADVRNVEHRFECVDLSKAPASFASAFGGGIQRYDIVLLLAVTHKLRRAMSDGDCDNLVRYFGERSKKYVGWRGHDSEMSAMDRLMSEAGLERIQYSTISETICPAAIWRRK